MLEVIKYPNPILKLKSEEIQDIDGSILNLIQEMIQTMKANNGVGLAMPQIGLTGRVIVFIDYTNTPKYRTMINPVIFGHGSISNEDTEGCLSIPGKWKKIWRNKEILVKFQEPSGKWKRETFSNLTARIIQHEIDHLDGILIND